jgi:hypothetical protein
VYQNVVYLGNTSIILTSPSTSIQKDDTLEEKLRRKRNRTPTNTRLLLSAMDNSRLKIV